MENKICTKCQRELPLDMFRWKNKSANKKHSQCKECQSKQEKIHYEDRKEAVLARTLNAKERNFEYIKQQKSCGCAKCGEKRFYVLDFHHKNPEEKEYNINTMRVSYSLEKIQAEIDKCVVLCSNCHREFHYLEAQNNLKIEDYLGVVAQMVEH